VRNLGFVLLILSSLVSVQSFSQILDGENLRETTLNSFIDQIRPGSVVLLGEQHGLAAHRDQHLQVLNALRNKGYKVSVGMEFINYTDQSLLNDYRNGVLNETEFLQAIKWGGFGFEFYRPQVLFPLSSLGETAIGLNISRQITGKISRQGLESLSSEEAAQLPPQFSLGRDSYRERFMEAAGSHCRVPQNCFIAQSAWDDTMAWNAVSFIKNNPDQVLVVMVGEFHVQYGGGIKWRIQQRSTETVVHTLSQLWVEGWSEADIEDALKVSPVEGKRADLIWISGRP
jgi:uncharacterized iron-regulated protein